MSGHEGIKGKTDSSKHEGILGELKRAAEAEYSLEEWQVEKAEREFNQRFSFNTFQEEDTL